MSMASRVTAIRRVEPGSQLVNQFVAKKIFRKVGLPVKTRIGFVKLPVQLSVMFDWLHPWFSDH